MLTFLALLGRNVASRRNQDQQNDHRQNQVLSSTCHKRMTFQSMENDLGGVDYHLENACALALRAAEAQGRKHEHKRADADAHYTGKPANEESGKIARFWLTGGERGHDARDLVVARVGGQDEDDQPAQDEEHVQADHALAQQAPAGSQQRVFAREADLGQARTAPIAIALARAATVLGEVWPDARAQNVKMKDCERRLNAVAMHPPASMRARLSVALYGSSAALSDLDIALAICTRASDAS